MIYFLHDPPRHYHTDRTYLTEWFDEPTLVITDVDINVEQPEDHLQTVIQAHHCRNVIVDLSHNQNSYHLIPEFLKQYPALTAEFTDWYHPRSPHTHYFPLWMWCFSTRHHWLHQTFSSSLGLDADSNKTLPMMCLNRNPQPHRVEFRTLIAPIESRIVYTFGDKTLPGESVEGYGLVPSDPGVGHPVYNQCAVNIVTESVMDRLALSEKSIKPFAARQIPVLVAPRTTNQFYQDLGFDMFEDLVPWNRWDQEPNHSVRMQLISDFVCEWLDSGEILHQYHSVRDRIDRNKNHLHSETFRELCLRHMVKKP